MFPTYLLHSEELHQEARSWWNPGPNEIKAKVLLGGDIKGNLKLFEQWKDLQSQVCCEVWLHAAVNGRNEE